jgi:glutathione S-transferase
MPWRGIIAVLLLVALMPLPCSADETADQVTQLLDAGWSPSLEANKQIDNLYRGTAPHPHVTFAYALVKMRQWRYDDALKTAEELLDDPRHGLAARRMQSWLLLSLKRYSESLVAMEKLAESLPDLAVLPDKEEARRRTVAEMGRMAGFLRGPAAGTISDFERDSRLRRLSMHLSEEEQAAFEAQSREVVDEFQKRIAERDRVEIDGAREFEAEQARRRNELDVARARLDMDLARLDDDQRKSQADADEELARLQAKEQPLRDNLLSLDGQAAVTQTNLLNVSAEISRLECRLEEEIDPSIRAFLQQDLRRLNFIGRGYANDLARLDSIAGRLQLQLADVAGEFRRADARFSANAKRLETRRKDLQQQRANLEREEKRIGREKPDSARAARTIEAHARSLTTYLPFPHDDERARLLEVAAK